MRNIHLLVSTLLLLLSLTSCSIYSLKNVSINDHIKYNETISELTIKNAHSLYCDSDSTYFIVKEAAITGMTDENQTVSLSISPTDTLSDSTGHTWTLNSISLRDYNGYISDTNNILTNDLKSKIITKALVVSSMGEHHLYSFTAYPAHIVDYKLALHYKERFIDEGGNIDFDKLDALSVYKIDSGKVALLSIGIAFLAFIVIGLIINPISIPINLKI